ncbi:MAG: hypothetical protein A3G87_02925 [Omnitrophica bacterium RIFCSPLOWO2_12_FULL_50_11]|nr:MAG: hypothetical protein A3G87_02925 [Omnitrophica bacterium RIFCSPLOWO2_12_FULL_50_11]
MNYYERVFKRLREEKVDYLIAGGVAVNLYGVPRFTKDLDILIGSSGENLRRLAKAVTALGYRPRPPVPLSDFLNPRNWSKWRRQKGMRAFALFHPKRPIEEIDLLVHSGIPFAEAKGRRSTVYFEGLRLHVVSIDDLMRMKRKAGRLQDLADIEALEKVKKARRK